MHISFRTRKYQDTIDASFHLFDGEKISNELWLVGDGVTFMFEVTDSDIVDSVNGLERDGFHIYSGLAHVPCTVVKRYHSASWAAVGRFQTILTSVLLEANDGYWEDLLIWIVTGQRPTWAVER